MKDRSRVGELASTGPPISAKARVQELGFRMLYLRSEICNLRFEIWDSRIVRTTKDTNHTKNRAAGPFRVIRVFRGCMDSFVFRICFVFRTSDFGFRLPLPCIRDHRHGLDLRVAGDLVVAQHHQVRQVRERSSAARRRGSADSPAPRADGWPASAARCPRRSAGRWPRRPAATCARTARARCARSRRGCGPPGPDRA